jgi:hypothetical protein
MRVMVDLKTGGMYLGFLGQLSACEAEPKGWIWAEREPAGI